MTRLTKGSAMNTKAFWQRLTADERRELMGLQTAKRSHSYYGGYLPDDCSECVACGEPMLGHGMCGSCSNRWNYLTAKGHGAIA